MASNWGFAARAAGLWRNDSPAPRPADAVEEASVLAPLHSLGYMTSIFGLRSGPTRDVRGVLFEPLHGGPPTSSQPCVLVYCPSESTGGACCTEATPIARMLLPLEIHLFALDLSGSHNYADGADVECAVRHIRDPAFRRSCGWRVPGPEEPEELPSIALWGRSAGANAVLNYVGMDRQITAIVCDSAYSDLPSLLGLPSWMASPFSGLRRLAEEVADASCGQKAQQVVPEAPPTNRPPWELATKLWMPALYVNGEQDDKVPQTCARALRSSHAGEAQLLLVQDGTHDSKRPDGVLAKMVLFVHRSMQRLGPEANRLAGAVENLSLLALGKEDSSFLNSESEGLSTMVFEPIRSPCQITGAGEWRDTLLNGALEAYPCCGAFTLVQLPESQDSAVLRYETAVTLRGEESEASLVWTSSCIRGSPSIVELVRITQRSATLVAVRLTPNDEEGRLQHQTKELAVAELAPGRGDMLVAVLLRISALGEVHVQVGASSLSAMGATRRGACLWRATVDCSAQAEDAAAGQRLQLAGLGCSTAQPNGYQASGAWTLSPSPISIAGAACPRRPYSVISGISSVSPVSRRPVPAGSLSLASSVTSVGQRAAPFSMMLNEETEVEIKVGAEVATVVAPIVTSCSVCAAGQMCVDHANTWPGCSEPPFERPLTWQAGDASC